MSMRNVPRKQYCDESDESEEEEDYDEDEEMEVVVPEGIVRWPQVRVQRP